VTVNIHSYEPYHIGIKINPALASDPVSLRFKLINAFKATSLEKEPTKLMGTEVLKKTKSGRVELNYDVFALNTIDKNPKSTLKMYNYVLSRVESLNYEIGGFAQFHEIVSNMNIKVSKDPITILNKMSKLNFAAFRPMVEAQTTGIRLGLPENTRDEAFSILMEVNPLNPKTMLVMRLVYRNKINLKVIELTKKIEQMVDNFLNSMVKDK